MLSILYHWNIPTLCRSSCVIICYTCNKVKLLNFTVSKNDQVFYPLIQWDSLFLLSDIMLWHWTSFITRGILFQKLNWYRQQDLMILSQCHSLTAEVTCTVSCVLGRVQLSAAPRSVAASFPFLCNCPGKNTGEGCHLLLQGVLLTPGLNPRLSHLLHWQAGSLPLRHLGAQTWPGISLSTEKQSLPKFISAKYLKYNTV